MNRIEMLLNGLALQGQGLEVSPYFNPAVCKDQYNVRYVDYVDNATLKKKAAENPVGKTCDVPEIDWVWHPGKRLRKCIPKGITFDYVVASHVFEHVPNVIGWLNEIFEVLHNDAKLALAIPDRRLTMDFYRRESTLGDIVGNWIESPCHPTPAQVMDFLCQSFHDTRQKPDDPMIDVASIPFGEVPRHYSDEKALEFAIWSHNTRGYLDVHCTVWTPHSFMDLMTRVSSLGLLNVEISQPIENPGRGEFIVHLTKKGESRIKRD